MKRGQKIGCQGPSLGRKILVQVDPGVCQDHVVGHLEAPMVQVKEAGRFSHVVSPAKVSEQCSDSFGPQYP